MNEDVPKVTEWMTATEVARHLGISRQSVNRMMNDGKFSTLHALGDRPIFVVRRSEVERLTAPATDPMQT